jgi:lipopolysaccharide/colanic/teichoic acid biosynthesis glycosyltransferase
MSSKATCRSSDRGRTTDAEVAIAHVAFDLEYVERWSLWTDVRIIMRTVRQEFLSGNGI